MLSSYATHAQLQTYASDRNVTLASSDTTVQDGALVRASMALDAYYSWRYVGTKTDYTQSLQWPRTGAAWPDGTAISGVPSQLVWATCELAILELVSPGSLSPVVTPNKIKTRARVEGAIDVSYGSGVIMNPVLASSPVSAVVEGIMFDLVGRIVPLPGVAFV